MSDMEFRTIDASRFEFRLADKAEGIIEVRANVLQTVDSYDSSFEPGVFDGAVRDQGFLPYLLLDHEMTRQIGRITDTRERRDGSGTWQWARARINTAKQIGQDALSDFEQGFRDAWSVGFASDPAAERYEQRDGRTVRLIRKLKVWPDLSSVLVPGGSGTALLSVRSEALLLPDRPVESAPRHIAILNPETDFDEFRMRVTEDEGKPVGMEYGHRPGVGWAITKISYPTAQWGVTEARAHCLAAGGHEFREAAGERGDVQTFALADLPALYVPEVRAVTEKPWDGAASRYSDTAAYCKACLIDENEPGGEKVQSKCHLPVYEPNGDLNANAVRNAAARLNQVQASADSKAAAGRKLDRLKKEAGIGEASDGGGERSAVNATDVETRTRLEAEARFRYAEARLADTGMSFRHSALSRKNTNTVRQAHDAMAAAIPGFCPNDGGSGEPDEDDTGTP